MRLAPEKPPETRPPTGGDSARPERFSAYSNRLSWTGVIVGIVLRTVQYLSNRSLWLDEAYLAQNLLARNAAQLLQQLDDSQVAPIGFLWPVKGCISLLGGTEYALRLVPFLAAIASLLLFHRLARRILSREAVPIAVGIFAISEPLLFYAAELKQYSTDVFWAVALISLMVSWWERPRRGRVGLLLLATGALAIFSSHPAIFVLAGFAVYCLAVGFRRKDGYLIRSALLVGSVWATLFLAQFVLLLRVDHSSGFFQEFWSGRLMPFPPTSVDDVEWFLRTFLEVFVDPVGLSHGALSGLVFLAGCIAFGARKHQLALLLAPIPVALLASGLESYPFATRFLLFLAPTFILVLAEGTLLFAGLLGARSRILAVVFGLLMFLQPTVNIVARIPLEREEIRPVIEHLAENLNPDDRIYAYWGAGPALTYYADRFGIEMDEVTVGRYEVRPQRGEFSKDLAQYRKGDRVWVVFSHFGPEGPGDHRFVLLNLVRDRGEELSRFEATGASAHYFEFSSDPAGQGR